MDVEQECRTQIAVRNRFGLHLRIAQQVVQATAHFRSSLTIGRGDILADARSILSILVLGAAQGVILDIHAVGPDANEAVAEIARILDTEREEELPKESLNLFR